MRIITWEPLTDRQTAPMVTDRIQPGETKPWSWHPKATAGRLDANAEAVILAHPFRRSWVGQSVLAAKDFKWAQAYLQAVVERCRPSVMFLDHPGNKWRMPDGGNRRSDGALALFRELLEPVEAMGVPVVQYGAGGVAHQADHPSPAVSPVLWSLGGTRAMLDWHLESPLAGRQRLVPWFRGIGGWAPNGVVPTFRGFLQQLLTAWACGAEYGCVWFNPAEVTDQQGHDMAIAIDLIEGLDVMVVTDQEEPRGGMGELLRALSSGADFGAVLAILSSWPVESWPHSDPDMYPDGMEDIDVPGEAGDEPGRDRE